MVFSEVERFCFGGGSKRCGVVFMRLSVSAVWKERQVAVRWKIDKGAKLGIQSRKMIFPLFQPGQRVGGVLGVPSTNEPHCEKLCSIRTRAAFLHIQNFVGMWFHGPEVA